MLRALPDDRRIAALKRVLAETKQIERAFYGVQLVADSEFRKSAARQVVQKYAAVQESHLLHQGLRALGPDGLSYFRAALLQENPDTKIFAQLREAFGHDPVAAFMQEAKVIEEKNLARLFRLAGEHAGPKERIYLLERRDLDDGVPPASAGSFSWSRGRGPGLPVAEKTGVRPQDDSEHILTIDLQEVPELQQRFPDARALTLSAPDPEHGDGWKRAKLRGIPASATAPTDGNPITVMPIEVPGAMFSYSACEKNPMLKELRGLVFNRPGYLLGEPMFIQEDEGGVGFVMQLAEQIGGLNLGDSGSLYVFESGSYMQCY